jgi:Immunity protein 50
LSAATVGDIPGGPKLLQWFAGRMPSFHDAEVLSLTLDRGTASAILRVHAFEMTSEVDARGYFNCTRHVVVVFKLTCIGMMELDGFNHQNALDGLKISRTDDGEIRLDLEPAYGLGGFIQARELEIGIEPGIPAGSQYLRPASGAASDT